MLVDLSVLLTQEGKQQKLEMEPEGNAFICELGSFPYEKKGPVSLVLTHTENRVVRIQAEGEITVSIPCSRCLEPVSYTIGIDYDEKLDMKQSDQERMDALDENSFVAEHRLDTEKLLHNELLIGWPMRVLCQEDCKGICSRCGANLNHGSCTCDTADLDPRMAVINDIFKNFKEV